MPKRDRSEGWRFAKTSGHSFEREFAKRVIDPNTEECKSLIAFAEKQGISGLPLSADAEKGVEQVSDFTGEGRTQSKTDVVIRFEKGETLNVSVKKPTVTHGQAHLTSLSRFLERVIERNGKEIPKEVDFVFRAFAGETNGKKILEYASKAKLQSPVIKKHNQQAELYQNRLYVTTIQESYPKEWRVYQDWWSENIEVITRIVFSAGYAKNESDFADAIYYGKSNQFFSLKEVELKSRAFVVQPRTKGYYAGSTLDMPWGYLQLHRPGKNEGPYQLQFHHDLKAIIKLLG